MSTEVARQSRARAVARIAGVVPMVSGVTVLIGWARDIQVLKSILPGIPNMNPVTATVFILAGIALLLSIEPTPRRRGIALACAGVVFGVGSLRLACYVSDVDLGMDTWLFHDEVIRVTGRNAIAPNTALNFLLSGAALVLLWETDPARRRHSALGAQGLAAVTAVIAALTVIGYTFGVREFYGLLRFFPMALHTGLNFFVLAFGILAARPEAGLASLATADDEGGRIARRLLPAALVLPLVLGYLPALGARAGLLTADFGLAVFVVSSMVVLTAVVLFQARSTSIADRALSSELIERRRAEVELRRANDELVVAREAAEAATRAKAQFLANMSHEIRTPLNAVIGMSSLLEDSPLAREQQDYVQTIRSSGEHLLSVINDILDFSKIEAGKLDLEQIPFDLRACVEQSIDLVSVQAARKDIELAFVIESRPPAMLIGDVGRVRQILANLLSNAVKFTSSGEVVVRVDAQALDRAEFEVHFSVRDTGPGIAPDGIERLFQSFSQVDSSTARRFGGTGLGLAISKRLAELMGGRIWVESEVGRGSTFHFTILAGTADVPVMVTRHARAVALAGRRVLVVDDNETNRRIVCGYLVPWEMVARATGDPHEAIEWIRRGDLFDVLITDYQMPGMDGLEMVRAMRGLPGGAALQVVLASSVGTGKEEARERGVRIDAHLTKPVKPAQVHASICRLLGAGKSHDDGDSAPVPLFDAALGKRHPLRILLAEDNPVNQKVATAMLEKLGYRADLAGDGVEVLESLERQRYDVVLMDVHMPRLDGLETARAVGERWPRSERPRIVAMTADAMTGDRERCLEAGMDDYISKPVRAGELAEALSRSERFAGDDGVRRTASDSDSLPTAVLSTHDLDALREMLGDEAFRDVVDTYVDSVPEVLVRSQELIASGTSEELVRLYHDLKSTSGTLGAQRLAALARMLELRATSRDFEGVARLAEELRAMIGETCAALRATTALRAP